MAKFEGATASPGLAGGRMDSRMTDPTTSYANAVLSGEILAGRLVHLACERHVRDLENGHERGLRFSEKAAKRAFKFFALLRLPTGQQFQLQPFQQFIVGSIFGWLNEDGSRRFRVAYIEEGKGNGKTPMAGSIGLYGLLIDSATEPAAEIYSAATTRDQAGIAFNDAKLMVEQSPDLAGMVSVNQFSLTNGSSVFRPVSSEHKGLDGKRVHIALIDEVHEHPSSLVVDKMRAGTKGRKNPLIFEITNSGFNRESVCWHHREYSAKILEQTLVDDEWFAYICGLDPCPACFAAGKRFPDDACGDCDHWDDESVWIKSNPGLGTILPIKYLRGQVREAQGMPSKQSIVKRLNFCIWTEAQSAWLNMEDWNQGATPIDAESLKGRMCYGGLDLARVKDLSALVLVFPPKDDGEPWKCLCWFWIPKDDITMRSRRDHVHYDQWEREGFVKATPGNTTDFDTVGQDIVDLSGIYDIVEIAYDRTFAGELVQFLMNRGIRLVEFGQDFKSLGPPTSELERLVISQKFQHGGNPVLRWCASNVVVRHDPAGNLKPDKETSTEKIDGIIATVMGLGRAMVAGAGMKPVFYDDNEVEFL